MLYTATPAADPTGTAGRERAKVKLLGAMRHWPRTRQAAGGPETPVQSRTRQRDKVAVSFQSLPQVTG